MMGTKPKKKRKIYSQDLRISKWKSRGFMLQQVKAFEKDKERLTSAHNWDFFDIEDQGYGDVHFLILENQREDDILGQNDQVHHTHNTSDHHHRHDSCRPGFHHLLQNCVKAPLASPSYLLNQTPKIKRSFKKFIKYIQREREECNDCTKFTLATEEIDPKDHQVSAMNEQTNNLICNTAKHMHSTYHLVHGLHLERLHDHQNQ